MSEPEQSAAADEVEAPAATAVEETPAEEAAPEAAAEAEQAETVAEPELDEETEALVEEGTPAEEYELTESVAATTTGRRARIYFCDRGHRTMAVWTEPSACHHLPLRSGPECGRPLYPHDQLPEQVQRALNPLKASKKASKGK